MIPNKGIAIKQPKGIAIKQPKGIAIKQPKGIAIILVIAVLAMLVLLAIPFAETVNVEKRETSNFLIQAKARLAALGTFEYSVAQLAKTTETYERYAKQERLFQTPDYDSPDEYKVNLKIPDLEISNPSGEIWSVNVEDEQGKVNINSATPWLLGNLMGSAIVQTVAEDSAAEIKVDSTHHFQKNNGYLWINGELISYERAETDRFMGCKRGLYSNSPRFTEAKTIRAGTLVIDPRAYRICSHRVIANPGYFTSYRTVEEIRRIADLGAYSIDSALFARIEPMLTVHSERNCGHGWICPLKIGNDLPNSESGSPDIISLPCASFYRPGMTVKVEENGQEAYALIREVVANTIVLDTRLEKRFDKDKATVSVLEPHRININSAHPKILYALFKGLRAGNDWIDSTQANILTSEIYGYRMEGKTFTSLAQFQQFLVDLRSRLQDAGKTDENKGEALTFQEIHAILSMARGINSDRDRFMGVRWEGEKISGEYIAPSPPFTSFLYRNYDTYTIEASSIINSPLAVPIAQNTIHRVVTVAPNTLLRWCMENQNHFEEAMNSIPSYRVITWPVYVRDFTAFPETSIPEGSGENVKNGISLDTVNVHPRLPEGCVQQQFFPWNDRYQGILCPGKEKANLHFSKDGLEIAPGAISFWFYPEQPGSRYCIFDMADKQWESRILILWENNKLIFRVMDSSMEEKAAEIIANIALERKWYHIAAAWYSTHPGCLALWVDGRPAGEFCYRHDTIIHKALLENNLKTDTNQIRISDTAGFPSQGVVQIGDEAIEYDSIQGKTLVVREKYEGFVREGLRRGARGTLAAEHLKGAWVSNFGYSDLLESKVFKATELTYDLAEESLVTCTTAKVNKKDSSISVRSTKRFQETGFLAIAYVKNGVVDKEIVHYIGTSGNVFPRCSRGQLNTKAQEFPENSYVFPISIMVKDSSEYEDAGMIQIDNEWMSYCKKVDPSYLIFDLPDSSIIEWNKIDPFDSPYRGIEGTLSGRHNYESKVIPVFCLKLGWAGRFDRITIIDGENQNIKEENIVNWTSNKYVAFADDVSRTYKPAPGCRILKFPSGELPTVERFQAWGNSVSPALTSASFLLDDVHLVQAKSKIPYRLKGIHNESVKEFSINTDSGFPQDGGIFKIGDEYIAYPETGENLNNVERSFLKTPHGVYSSGTLLFPIFFIPVSTIYQQISLRSPIFSIKNSGDFSAEGYVMCNNEIIGYTSKTIEGGRNLMVMPKDISGQGLLRGCYGTEPGTHLMNDIAYQFPTRYWDRCLWGYDGPECAYFQAAKTAPGALWKKITWNSDLPSSHLGIHVRARIDGKPSWEEVPSNQPGGLFQFDNGQSANKLELSGDTLEIRVYFSYKKGAYSQNYWKDKAFLKSLFVEYQQPVRIWESHEE